MLCFSLCLCCQESHARSYEAFEYYLPVCVSVKGDGWVEGEGVRLRTQLATSERQDGVRMSKEVASNQRRGEVARMVTQMMEEPTTRVMRSRMTNVEDGDR